MSDFRKLAVWRKAHALTLNVHRTVAKIRRAEHGGMRNQILRAANSIPTNIVEGTGQDSGKEFGRFLSIAVKSASELEYHLTLARDLRLISNSDYQSLSSQAIEVRKMLYGLRNRVTTTPRVTRRNVPTS
jgi:four helix bundle protein